MHHQQHAPLYDSHLSQSQLPVAAVSGLRDKRPLLVRRLLILASSCTSSSSTTTSNIPPAEVEKLHQHPSCPSDSGCCLLIFVSFLLAVPTIEQACIFVVFFLQIISLSHAANPCPSSCFACCIQAPPTPLHLVPADLL